jgi:hypothetical protein
MSGATLYGCPNPENPVIKRIKVQTINNKTINN